MAKSPDTLQVSFDHPGGWNVTISQFELTKPTPRSIKGTPLPPGFAFPDFNLVSERQSPDVNRHLATERYRASLINVKTLPEHCRSMELADLQSLDADILLNTDGTAHGRAPEIVGHVRAQFADGIFSYRVDWTGPDAWIQELGWKFTMPCVQDHLLLAATQRPMVVLPPDQHRPRDRNGYARQRERAHHPHRPPRRVRLQLQQIRLRMGLPDRRRRPRLMRRIHPGTAAAHNNGPNNPNDQAHIHRDAQLRRPRRPRRQRNLRPHRQQTSEPPARERLDLGLFLPVQERRSRGEQHDRVGIGSEASCGNWIKMKSSDQKRLTASTNDLSPCPTCGYWKPPPRHDRCPECGTATVTLSKSRGS